MAIERFSKERFESALPTNKVTGEPLWVYDGLQAGEHCYKIPVAGKVVIYVRSTVREDGFAADTACDSIRCWLVDMNFNPLGNKTQKYITRVKGWNDRMIKALRTLWKLGKSISAPCSRCGGQRSVYKVMKDGPNQGRFFTTCPTCEGFDWLEIPNE
jgi:hypothetical protein